MSWLAMLFALAMLWSPRVKVVVWLVMAQVLAVAIAQPDMLIGTIYGIAGLAAGFALHREPNRLSLPMLAQPIGGGGFAVSLGGALILPALLFEPVTGALSLVLAACLLLATRRNPVVHAVAFLELHNGIALLSPPLFGSLLSGSPLAELAMFPLAALPALPCLGLLALRVRFRILPAPVLQAPVLPAPAMQAPAMRGGHAGRRTITLLQTGSVGKWLGFGIAAATLLAVLAIPWSDGVRRGMFHLDRLTAWFVVLFVLAALARRFPATKQGATFRALDQIQLGCVVFACLIADASLAWLAVAVATAAGLAPMVRRRWDVVPMAGAGLGLALFGVTMFGVAMFAGGHVHPALAAWCVAIGYAAVASVVPALAVPLLLQVLRLPGPDIDGLSITGGLMIVLVCAAWLLRKPGNLPGSTALALGQVGVAAFAFGLGAPDAKLAGMIHLSLLTLAVAATALAPVAGWQRFAAVAGLAGLPPFGVFSGLAMVVSVGMTREPWLVGVLIAAVATMAGATLARSGFAPVLPAEKPVVAKPVVAKYGAALAPLALAAILGWFMPAPMAEWLLTIVTQFK